MAIAKGKLFIKQEELKHMFELRREDMEIYAVEYLDDGFYFSIVSVEGKELRKQRYFITHKEMLKELDLYSYTDIDFIGAEMWDDGIQFKLVSPVEVEGFAVRTTGETRRVSLDRLKEVLSQRE